MRETISAHLLIVEARFYEGILDALAAGAEAAIAASGATCERLVVPGALEIPAAIAMAAEARRFDGFVALGCVIRGETTHYEIVSNESSRGLMDLALRERLAIGNGILTVENEEQAWERARPERLNKGGGAAEAALRMIAMRRLFGLSR
ncbi:MAG: 6,7-dimethyl-8-ribityllumazine synthase [Alphaproteobacteria bacterium]|nr:6,7-dimethyl-8-ribityllumazine synthase [Alphaproteobacteria bacterium]